MIKIAAGQITLTPETLELVSLLAHPEESVDDAVTRLISDSAIAYFVRLSPREFESLVGRSLESRGYTVTYVGGSGDEGIDLLATKDTEHVAVQCKRYDASPITPNQIREFLGAIVNAQATAGVFVTTSSFTQAARAFAAAQSIELVDSGCLVAWLIQRPDGPTMIRCGKCGAAATSLNEWTRAWICAACKSFNSVE